MALKLNSTEYIISIVIPLQKRSENLRAVQKLSKNFDPFGNSQKG
jgi:hypothetical protein